jgi:hypothetical protein
MSQAPSLTTRPAAQNDPCTQTEFTINSQADITGLGRCRTLRGNVVVGEQTDAKLDFSGFTTIDGDFSVLNNKFVTDISSSSIGQITGTFHLQNLTALSNLGFSMLKSVGGINFVSLTAIDTLSFTSGVSQASKVVVSDTFLSSLNGLNMVSLESMDINNNRRLVRWDSKLTSLSGTLIINANGLNLAVALPSLLWINEARISNVSTFEVPALSVVNDSLRFDSNFFRTFAAPNLTHTEDGDVSFVSNPQLTNVSMPLLTSLGGGLLIANNTGLSKVDGFPLLKTVGGAVKFRGNFTEYVSFSLCKRTCRLDPR